MIKFLCGYCGQKLGVPDEYAGRRVRCSKCNQPNAVPALQMEAATIGADIHAEAQMPPAIKNTETTESLDKLELEDSPDDAREQAIRFARQQRDKAAMTAAKGKHAASSIKAVKSSRSTSGRMPIADMVPEMLRLPLGLLLSLSAMCGVIAVWIYSAKAAGYALNFFALFVPIAAALAFKLVTVNRTFFLGVLGTLIGALGIAAGKAAIAQYVVIPIQREFVNSEVLTDMPKLLADERYQLQKGSVKNIARDGDMMTCIALFSLVSEGKADPVIARRWAFDILRSSNKTNIYAALTETAGSGPDVPMRPDIQESDTPMFEAAWQRMAEWEESETELQNARTYYAALNCVSTQCEVDRLLSRPDTAFKFALLDTIGLLDLLWILAGMGLAYISLAMDNAD